MQRAVLALWLIAVIFFPTIAGYQSLEASATKPGPAESHSVVVDLPQVVSLPPASPEAWETFWKTLPPAVPIDEQSPATGQTATTSPEPSRRRDMVAQNSQQLC